MHGMKVVLGWVILWTLGGMLAVAEDRFVPEAPWLDRDGVAINAHGGGVLHHRGTYYWFGDHKVAGRGGNAAQVGVSCYSSDNLYDWHNEGIALSVSPDPDHEIAKGSILERPKVIYNEKTGRFVMWFHLEHRGEGYKTARTAVATAEQVTGPYHFRKSVRPNAGKWPMRFDPDEHDEAVKYLKRDHQGGQMARDMTLFVDDDGRAYHIAAAEENKTLHVSLLTPDYLGFSGKYVRVAPGGNNEAPAICKHDGYYWMITSGCTGWAPNEARSFRARSMAGPWESLGNPCKGPHPTGGPGPSKTWGGQSTFLLAVEDRPGSFIAMFDVWRPENPIDGRYLWLPVHFKEGRIEVTYPQTWSLPDPVQTSGD